jgi:hypothetical protein
MITLVQRCLDTVYILTSDRREQKRTRKKREDERKENVNREKVRRRVEKRERKGNKDMNNGRTE